MRWRSTPRCTSDRPSLSPVAGTRCPPGHFSFSPDRVNPPEICTDRMRSPAVGALTDRVLDSIPAIARIASLLLPFRGKPAYHGFQIRSEIRRNLVGGLAFLFHLQGFCLPVPVRLLFAAVCAEPAVRTRPLQRHLVPLAAFQAPLKSLVSCERLGESAATTLPRDRAGRSGGTWPFAGCPKALGTRPLC